MSPIGRAVSGIVTALGLLAAMPAWSETRLLMAEEHGCVWCERWNEEISHKYPKTSEGKAAPLQRFDVHGDPPPDVTFAKRVHFTPTFILVIDGEEADRIEGYPGEDFFWPLLTMMLERSGIDLESSGS